MNNEAILPTRVIKTIKSIMEIRNPVTAKPRGDLNMPIKDKRNPKNQTIHPITGSHEKNNEIRANTKPAVPTPLDSRTAWLIITVCL